MPLDADADADLDADDPAADTAPVRSSRADRLVVEAVAAGREADLTQLPPEHRDVSATLIGELIRSEPAGVRPPAYGIRIRGALFSESIDLRYVVCAVPVMLVDCTLAKPLLLQSARIPNLSIDGCELADIRAAGLRLEHDLRILRTRLVGKVGLRRAMVGGMVVWDRVIVESADGIALDATQASMSGGMMISGSEIDGGVLLWRATTGGILVANTSVRASGRAAIDARNAEVVGDLNVGVATDAHRPQCEVVGGITLQNARIRGDVLCVGAHLTNEGGDAISATGATIDGAVNLTSIGPDGGRGPVRCEIVGEVDLTNSTIGTFLCIGARIANGTANAVNFFAATVTRTIVFYALPLGGGEWLATEISGTIQLTGVTAQMLLLMSITLRNPGSVAMQAETAQVPGEVVLTGDVATEHGEPPPCQISGAVHLRGAMIGQFSATAVTIGDAGHQAALDLDLASITGSAVLDRSAIVGEVRAVRAGIGGQLLARNATLNGQDRAAVTLDGANIAGDFLANDTQITGETRLVGTAIGGALNCWGARLHGVVRLDGCRAAELLDDMWVERQGLRLVIGGCWAAVEDLALDGFRYGRFGGNATWDHHDRFRWLRSCTGQYRPGPWDQLRRVYLDNGYEDEARRTAIEARRDQLARGPLTRRHRWWRRLLGATIGHGYRPARAGAWSLLAIAVFSLVVWTNGDQLAYVGGDARSSPATVTASGRPGGPVPPPMDGWTAVAYATDTFVPVGDLNVADDWRPVGWMEPVRFGFVVLGWLLGTLFVAGFTRIVRT